MFSIPSTKPGGEVVIDAEGVKELLSGKIIALPAPKHAEPIELAGGERAEPAPEREPETSAG